MVPPNGRQVQYGYGTTGAIDDIMSRLASIGDGANTYAAYKYLGAGRIVTEDYENVEVKLDYTPNDFAAFDRFGRVLDQIWTDYGADPDVVLDHYSYTYDRAGNRTSRGNELHSAFDEDYMYDNGHRLASATRADNFDQSWTLDGLGNFSGFDDDGSSQTRTANAANEITAITGGWITPVYDQAGNMISGPKPGSGTTRVHYVYDAWNRLVEVRVDDSGEPGDLIAEYQYDGTNRRIEKVVTVAGGGPSEAHCYYNAEWQLLEERFLNSQEQLSASDQYLWSARYIDSPVTRFHDANGDGDCLDAGDNIRYYAGDTNFNATATIDAGTGAVVERYVYTAYGVPTVYDGSWANPTAPATDGPLYCGYFFDTETVLYHVRNRYYDSSLSAFISRDPTGYQAGDPSLYRYVVNGPANYSDPRGLDQPPHFPDRPGGCHPKPCPPDPPPQLPLSYPLDPSWPPQTTLPPGIMPPPQPPPPSNFPPGYPSIGPLPGPALPKSKPIPPKKSPDQLYEQCLENAEVGYDDCKDRGQIVCTTLWLAKPGQTTAIATCVAGYVVACKAQRACDKNWCEEKRKQAEDSSYCPNWSWRLCGSGPFGDPWPE